MAKKLLIDASHHEERRMAVIDGNRLHAFETESSSKRPIKSNIYLAKIIRIEPALQAAFVEYGGNRQGFLPFAEIHPDYYQIPVGDRLRMEAEIAEEEKKEAEIKALEKTNAEAIDGTSEPSEPSESLDPSMETEESGDSDRGGADEDIPKKSKLRYRYKIQEVIKRRQIVLVQAVREERGGKGAALSTYLSLAGKYCVMMPNSGNHTGGISRKITDVKDRKRLRGILDSLDIPEGMSLIVRTAGSGRTKLELKRDFDFLIRQWAEIRDNTLISIAPKLIYEEGDLIKRSLRDVYDKDTDEILIEGDDAYKAAKLLMRTLLPSHAKKVQQYRHKNISLFQKFKIEDQIDQMFQPKVDLPSGGSLVIAQTEALVAIDVNSGKSTRERDIRETALKTNLEAAKEVARQMRLRDLAGLVVIDFIDMSDEGHIKQVERALKEATTMDRARMQLGKISQFGLLELSRQRLRPSLLENNTKPCEACHGTGVVRSVNSMALFVLRQIESTCVTGAVSQITAFVPVGVDLYLLNQKRHDLVELENLYHLRIFIERDDTIQNANCRIETVTSDDPEHAPVVLSDDAFFTHVEEDDEVAVEEEVIPENDTKEVLETTETSSKKRGNNLRKRRRKRSGDKVKTEISTQEEGVAVSVNTETEITVNTENGKTEGEESSEITSTASTDSPDQAEEKRRRKRRPRDRRRRKPHETSDGVTPVEGESISISNSISEPTSQTTSQSSPQPTSTEVKPASMEAPTPPAMIGENLEKRRNRRRRPVNKSPRPTEAQKSSEQSSSGELPNAAPTSLSQENKASEAPALKEPTQKKTLPSSEESSASGEDKKRKGWWKRLIDS